MNVANSLQVSVFAHREVFVILRRYLRFVCTSLHAHRFMWPSFVNLLKRCSRDKIGRLSVRQVVHVSSDCATRNSMRMNSATLSTKMSSVSGQQPEVTSKWQLVSEWSSIRNRRLGPLRHVHAFGTGTIKPISRGNARPQARFSGRPMLFAPDVNTHA